MIKRSTRRGDTLIEVMLAVGIFSMVAVAVVAVMSGGTSSAQTALETTLTREEIDNQAEVLRFIHRSYIADKTTQEDSAFGRLWKEITSDDNAVTAAAGVNSIDSKFHPDSCQELYDKSSPNSIRSEVSSKAFVIDPTALYTYEKDNDINKVIIRATSEDANNKFQAATTYPHLVYGKDKADASDINSTELSEHTDDATGAATNDKVSLYSVDGIYVTAVKDPSTTTIAGSKTASGSSSAYYDFYIRTCWYGTGDQNPSTISTVIRLYDPDLSINN